MVLVNSSNTLSPDFIAYLNPLSTLVYEFAVITGVCLYFLIRGVDLWVWFMFVGMQLLTKGVPIYLLWDSGSPVDVHAPAIALVAVYCLYLYMHRTDPVKIYGAILRSVLQGTYRPLPLHFLNRK